MCCFRGDLGMYWAYYPITRWRLRLWVGASFWFHYDTGSDRCLSLEVDRPINEVSLLLKFRFVAYRGFLSINIFFQLILMPTLSPNTWCTNLPSRRDINIAGCAMCNKASGVMIFYLVGCYWYVVLRNADRHSAPRDMRCENSSNLAYIMSPSLCSPFS